MLGMILRRDGHTPGLFSEPTAGLTRVRAEKPAWRIPDQKMPRLSGLAVCRRLRRRLDVAHWPIWTLRARVGAKDRLEALASGAGDYFVKPISTRPLIERVNQLFASAD